MISEGQDDTGGLDEAQDYIMRVVGEDPGAQANGMQGKVSRHTQPSIDGTHKIFVGGLGQEMTQERFDEYFSLYGELVDSVVMTDKASGRSRGFGFVKYADEAAAEKVMQDFGSHSIDGHSVEVKRCVPKQEGKGAGNGNYRAQAPVWPQHAAPVVPYPPSRGPPRSQTPRGPTSAKVFVGGIPQESATQSLTDHFSQYGEIVDAIAMVDKQTNKGRGFGFVTYARIESAEAVIQAAGSHYVDGKAVEVKRCVPKEDDFHGGPHEQRMQAPPHFAPQAKGNHFGKGHHHAPMQQPMMRVGAAPAMDASAFRTDKIFLGGLGACNEDVLVSYFGQYTIVDAVVMRDKGTGKSKGFGFVQFDHFGCVDEIMQFGQPPHIDGRFVEVNGNHILNNKHVEVKRSIPKEAMATAQSFRPNAGGFYQAAQSLLFRGPQPSHHAAPPYQAPPRKGFGKAGGKGAGHSFGPAPSHKGSYPSGPPSGKAGGKAGGKAAGSGNKLFVGGLGECSDEELVAYFSQFGTLVDHVVMKDKANGRPRGFGFVTYDDPAALDTIMSMYSEHQIGGKWIEVKRADGKSDDKGKGRPMPY